jgi:hypothetical protein
MAPQQLGSSIPLILLFTALGFIIGATVAYFVARNEARKEQTPAPDLDLIQERSKRFEEVTGLWRERASGKLAVWLGNRMLGDPNLVDVAERQRLEAAGRELLAWLGLGEKPVAPASVEQEPLEARIASVTAVPAPPQAVTKPAQSEATLAEHPQPAGEVVVPEEPAKPPKPLSIVEQIDEILQGMIKDTPLAARSIRLVEDPREGVIVLVGLDRYKGVDSVPDQEIKLALRRAAGEWERRVGKPHH